MRRKSQRHQRLRPRAARVCRQQGGPGLLARCLQCLAFVTCVAFSAFFLSEISLIEIGFTPHVSAVYIRYGAFRLFAVLESLRAPRAWASFFCATCFVCAPPATSADDGTSECLSVIRRQVALRQSLELPGFLPLYLLSFSHFPFYLAKSPRNPQACPLVAVKPAVRRRAGSVSGAGKKRSR